MKRYIIIIIIIITLDSNLTNGNRGVHNLNEIYDNH